MVITAFNGSPWGRNGHTHIITEHFLLGAHNAGAKIHNILLNQKDIKMCCSCGTCFYKTPGKCSIKDDMPALIHNLLNSDVVLFASPLYIDGVTALMKIFIDRLILLLEPHYEKDASGQYHRRLRYEKHPKFMVISSCALPGQEHFQAVQLFFKRMAKTMHTEIVAEIYRDQAGVLMLSDKEPMFRNVVEQYEKLLQIAGQEFARTGKISHETNKNLHETLTDPDHYAQYANNTWDAMLPKRDFLGIPIESLSSKHTRKVKV